MTCEYALSRIPGNRRLLRQQDWQREALGLGGQPPPACAAGMLGVAGGEGRGGAAATLSPHGLDGQLDMGIAGDIFYSKHLGTAPSWEQAGKAATAGDRQGGSGEETSGDGKGGREWGGVTYVKSWRLNERHYGDLQVM